MEHTQRVIHPFAPIWSRTSKVLILGSLPSVKSREQNFYYGHPQNRFWRVISTLVGEELPETTEEKRTLLLHNDIAVWDVIYSCEIIGSSDSSIRNVIPTDLQELFEKTQIKRIFCNGKTAGKYYHRFQEKDTGISATILPSTSPANAVYSVDRLIQEWRIILEA